MFKHILSVVSLCAISQVMACPKFDNAAVRASTTDTTAAYVTIQVDDKEDALTGASCPLAQRVELHDTIDEKGVMKMRQVSEIPLPKGVKVVLAPGGKHLMLMGLDPQFKTAKEVTITLTFKQAKPHDVVFPVKDVIATS